MALTRYFYLLLLSLLSSVEFALCLEMRFEIYIPLTATYSDSGAHYGRRVQSGAEATAGGERCSAGEDGDHTPQPGAAPAAASGQWTQGDDNRG